MTQNTLKRKLGKTEHNLAALLTQRGLTEWAYLHTHWESSRLAGYHWCLTALSVHTGYIVP